MSDPKKLCPCGNLAKYLCDSPRRFTREEMLQRLKAGERINGERATCDAPLCDSCREPPGVLFSCRRSGRGRGCEVDSIDRCRKCAVKATLGIT